MTDVASPCAKARDFTVLVVDDEPLVRMNAVAMLEAAGFKVVEAQCGSSGLAAVDRHPEVMVLFTDINMPGEFDGLELARRVHFARPDIHLILTSGLMRPRSAELSGGQFIPKPYDDASVTEMIGYAVTH
jgi:CheY-like chemotaxis protein